jgi:hypothetical protein
MPQDYKSTISLISGRIGSIPIEVGILLLSHEARLERFCKMASPTINFTASSTANEAESTQALSSNLEQQSFLRFSNGSGERGGHSGCRGHGGNGCGGRSSIQCQVCHKFGHHASICYHRFKKDYTPSVPLDHQQKSNNSNFPGPIPLILWLMVTFPNHPCHGSLTLALYHGLIILRVTLDLHCLFSLCFSTWHNRLGHPSADSRRSVLNLCKIPFSNKSVLISALLAV